MANDNFEVDFLEGDPPPRKGPMGMDPKLSAFWATLSKNPGKWAIYPGHGSSVSGAAKSVNRRMTSRDAKAGRFEGTSRKVGDKVVGYAIYIKY